MTNEDRVKETVVEAKIEEYETKERLEDALGPILDEAGVDTDEVHLDSMKLDSQGELEITLKKGHSLHF